MAVDVKKFLNKAREAVERRNYDLAMFNYKQALAFTPDDLNSRMELRATQMRAFTEKGTNSIIAGIMSFFPFLKAKKLAVSGKHEQAILACEDVLTKNPKYLPALKTLARSAAALEKFELAAWQMKEIVTKLDADSKDVLYDLVDYYSALGQNKDAIEICERIKKLDPNGDIDTRIRELSANDTVDIYKKGAEQGARNIVKDADEARDLEDESQIARTDEMRIRKAAALHKKWEERPDDYKLLLREGDAWSTLENFEEAYKKAKECYDKAFEIMPSDHNVKVKQGDLEIKRYRHDLKALKEQARGGSEDAKSRFMALRKELNEFEIKEYERRVDDQPLLSAYHQRLGELYLASKQYDKAVAEFQQSCKDPKYSISAYTSMGQAFCGMDQYDLGIDMYRKAMAGQDVFGKIKDTVYFLGCALEECGQLQEALKEYTKIFEDDIKYKDIKEKVPALRNKIKAES